MTDEELGQLMRQCWNEYPDMLKFDTFKFGRLVAEAERERMKSEGWRHCAEGQRTTQYCGLLEDAVKAEREQCAKRCEEVALLPDAGPFYCAAAIRARGKA
jgi:hypothetical protein